MSDCHVPAPYLAQAVPPQHATRAMGELERALHLVRPNGERWSDEFDRLMRPRLVNALRSRYDRLGREKVWCVQGDEVVYAEWSRAFLNKAWDGVSFNRTYAETLLAKDYDHNDDEDDDDHHHHHHHHNERGGGARLVRDEDGETVMPGDSVSNIVMRHMPVVPQHNPGSLDDLSFEEIRGLMLRGAGNLMDFKWLISFQDHGVVPAPRDGVPRREAERLRERCLDELKVLERALDRAAARRLGIRQGEMASPAMGGIWGQLLGGLGLR